MSQIILRLQHADELPTIEGYTFELDGKPVEESEAIRRGFVVEPCDTRETISGLRGKVEALKSLREKKKKGAMWRN